VRKWIPAVLIAASYLFSAWAYPGLPERVSPRWETLFPGIPAGDAEAMPRLAAAFLIPTLALVIWLVLRGKRILPGWLVSERTGAGAVERFGPTFNLIVILVVGFVVLLHVVTLGTAIGWPGWTSQAFTGAIGVGLIVLGNVMPRTRPNWVAGLRTRETLSDPDLWRRTHRYFGALLMVTGFVVIVVSLIATPYALLSAGAGFLLSGLLAWALGRRRSASAAEPPPVAGIVMLVLLAGSPPPRAQDAPSVPAWIGSLGIESQR
jgi:uncharacterized membrane protein